MSLNISYQLELRPALSTIYGPKDYVEFKEQLKQIDKLLILSGVEDKFLLKTFEKTPSLNFKRIPFYRMMIRTLILQHLTNESYRNLSFRLADSTLFRWFIGADTLKGKKTPSKSTIQRFEQLWSKEEISSLIHNLNKKVSDGSNSQNLLFSNTPIQLNEIYADSTCIKSNIHYPVDWLLFRDSVKTLMKSINLIRSQGLLHRMKNPSLFEKRINSLSIEMSQSNRNRNNKKKFKSTFRKMKLLLKIVKNHGQRYYNLLKEKWSLTDWSKKQSQQVLNRMINVLNQIPKVIELAHKRIIRGEKIKNSEKILSLYEKEVNVIKRGKIDADVEFGNVFYLAEQQDGIIVDWDYNNKECKTDHSYLRPSIERITKNYNEILLYATDRGFNSKKNNKYLEQKKIFNGTCSRNPAELKIQMGFKKYCKAQKRRAQTEGRIGIFKNKFIGKKILRKGIENCNNKILWSILSHNLWVLARKAIKNFQAIETALLEAA